MRAAWLLSALLGVVSCDVTGDCTAIALPFLEIDIVDARTGALLADGSTVVVTGSGGADSVTHPVDAQPSQRIAVFDSHLGPGMYSVTVRRHGYRTWTRSNLLVRARGDCGHVKTLFLVAELEAQP